NLPMAHTYVFDNNGQEDLVIVPLGAQLTAQNLWGVNGFPMSEAGIALAEQAILDNIIKQYIQPLGKDVRLIDDNDSWIIQRALDRYRATHSI
ncbi:hypothetical protein, partial [Alicyclobacillus hesperidum]|uniref:hypothetical protein n=1 Tax=Alicyclobacillus hesperidum TaxID=89784 RepID=UPI0024924D94